MEDTNKYAINDDELDVINGGKKAERSEFWWQNYTINGYTYGYAAEVINEFKRLKTVDSAIGFANKQLFHDSEWERLRTEDAVKVCRSLFEKFYMNH